MVHEKFLLQYIVCADKLRDMSWLLGLATIKAYVYACEFYHWHLLDMSNHEPYLCMGFDSSWCISVCVGFQPDCYINSILSSKDS